MSKFESLKAEATRAATWRGHTLGAWGESEWKPGQVAAADCIKCGCGVSVDTNPMPNGIDIGGAAVAINCGDENCESVTGRPWGELIETTEGVGNVCG